MIDPEFVRKQAKQIMDEFIKALDRVGAIKEEYGLEREDQTRVPGSPDFPGFRERMFKNAPKKNSDFIVMEKKKW